MPHYFLTLKFWLLYIQLIIELLFRLLVFPNFKFFSFNLEFGKLFLHHFIEQTFEVFFVFTNPGLIIK
jgi:hypothetical protein